MFVAPSLRQLLDRKGAAIRDSSTIVSEIEWLVKNHCRFIPDSHKLPNPSTNRITRACEDESYSMKINFDVFVKLHQMLHNYIGLLNYRGPKSRDIGCLKIPLNEALDVAVRAMISAMRSSAPEQPSSTPICLNCSQSSECRRCRSVDSRNKCDSDKLLETEEVDKKLSRLKRMTMENVEDVEVCIKDVLRAVTKLPLTAMTRRLEILSSVVRKTKNELTSCGRSNAESLMRTQVTSISEIISEFIREYGEIKSKVYPCRKVCRFCGSFICPMDRQRSIFCCENSKHLNFLWKEWVRENSVKGVAKWDEDTIVSIVDSFKDTPALKQCLPDGPCANFCRTAAERRVSRPGGEDEGGGNEKVRDEIRKRENKISSDFYPGENRTVDNRPGGQSEIGRLETGEKRASQNAGVKSRSRASQKRDKDKGRETNFHNSNRRSVGEEYGVGKTSDLEKTNRKKGPKKDPPAGVNFNDRDDSLGVDGSKKSRRSGKGDPRKTEGDLHPEDKGRRKSNGKNEGEFPDHGYGGNRKIRNTGKPGGPESSKNGGDSKSAKKDNGGGEKTEDTVLREKGNKKGTREAGGSEKDTFEKNDEDGITRGKKTREKYNEPDGKWSSGGELEVKSGKKDEEENIIHYQLSNKLFIELGWTLLPKDTVMRRVVEFQTSLAKPHMNWLKNNSIHGRQYYTDGKTIFTNFLEDGSGHVYYPNGQAAISAQTSKKGPHQIYKVYAMGSRDVKGVMRLPWLMAVFDSMGNGVVYDDNCDIRVTYNQHGGIYLDNPAKVPFSWGWNNFQTFPIDEAVYEDPLLDHLPPEFVSTAKELSSKEASKQSRSSKLSEDRAFSEVEESRPSEPVKVLPRKVITQLKPICLKMNKYLSLRILDRKNINLQYFAGSKSVRIELGTEINPNVQVNSRLIDRDEEITKNRLHTDVIKAKMKELSPENSLVEISKEYDRAKNIANLKKSAIAKIQRSRKIQQNSNIVDVDISADKTE